MRNLTPQNTALKGAPVLGSDGRRGTITKLSRPWVRIDWLPDAEEAANPNLLPMPKSQAFLRGDPALSGIQVMMGQGGGKPLSHIAGSKALRAECACEQSEMTNRKPLMRVRESGGLMMEGGNPFAKKEQLGPAHVPGFKGKGRKETGMWKCQAAGGNQECTKQKEPGKGNVVTIKPWAKKDEYNAAYYKKVVKPARDKGKKQD